LLAHSLEEKHSAWQALSSERHTAPCGPTFDPLWQQSVLPVHDWPGLWQTVQLDAGEHTEPLQQPVAQSELVEHEAGGGGGGGPESGAGGGAAES